MIKHVSLVGLALAAGALTLTAPGTRPAHAAATATGARAGAFTCEEVDARLPDLFARACDSQQWGPVSDFIVIERNTSKTYTCKSGWAEGSLWIQGRNCRQVQT